MNRAGTVPLVVAGRMEMFEWYTEDARRVLVLAGECAQKLRHSHIGPEHFFLALVEFGKGPVVEALFALNISPSNVWTQARVLGQAAIVEEPGSRPFSAGAKRTLGLSRAEATHLGHNYVGPEHLLLGLITHLDDTLAEPEIASEILELLHVSPKSLRQELLARVASN